MRLPRVHPRISRPWQVSRRLRPGGIAWAFGKEISPHHADLLDLAMSVYQADRLTLRGVPRIGTAAFQQPWTRRLNVEVNVRDVSFWQSSTVEQAVVDLLQWLTGNTWHVKFRPITSSGFEGEGQQFLFSTPPVLPARVALFSGGLDSLAGAVNDIIRWPSAQLILATVSTNSRMAAAQRTVIRKLYQRSDRVQAVQVPLGLRHAPRRQEASQRSRGLVFLTVGYCIAAAADSKKFYVYENGVGALNLPLTPAQIGTHNTRSVHPRTLYLASKLFSMVGDMAFEVENPSIYSTKAQLVAAMSEPFRELILDTFSCDTAYASRVASVVRCGRCTSCLLRRQSLWSAGLRSLDLAETYKQDGFSATLDGAAIETLSVMLFQVASFRRCLDSSDPWTALLLTFPALAALPSEYRSALSQAIVKLLEDYVGEWQELPIPVVQSFLEEQDKTLEWRHDRRV
jgi:hypothetical protein